MSIRADTFKQAVRTAANDYYGLTAQDIKNLRALFGSLDGSNRKEALGYLLEGNYTSLYKAVCRESVPGSLSLSTFTNGVSAADDRYYGIDRQERDNLKDAFSRLSSQDQGRALEYLLSNNYNTLLSEVERVANRSAGLGFAGFKAGVQAADDRYYGIDSSERKTLGDAFCRLTTQDQSRALEYVLECNYTALFNQIEGSAGNAASIGLKGFTASLRRGRSLLRHR